MQYVKYPRTHHLPFSLGSTSDDKVLKSDLHFESKEVIVTVKMDGECTTMYPCHIHARSLDSAHHPSRNWIKSFHGSIQHLIPENYRICGENLFACHSIKYDDLQSYFYGFSAWNNNLCLDWDSTISLFNTLGIVPVDVLYRGTYSNKVVRDIVHSLDTEKHEGIVIRLASSFLYDNFKDSVAKWVRAGHVATDQHWMHSELVKNKLKD